MKKLWISFAITLIAAFVMSSLAVAAALPSSSVTRPGNRLGRVNSVARDRFTMLNGGVEKTILVSSSTRFVKVNGDEKTFNNLATGQWVIAFGSIDEHRDLVAEVVLIAPRKFNPSDWGYARQYGRVLSTDPRASTFRVNATSGFITFTVEKDTHFSGEVKGLRSLSTGMTVFVSYQRAARGALVVKSMVAVP